MDNTVKRGRGCVYLMKYHIVWVTKYRKDVLVGKVEQRLKEMIYEIAERSDITI